MNETAFDYDPTLRRLPVYILVDCSGSMSGDAVEAVDQGFRNLKARLTGDPHTAEIVWMSFVVFDSIPRQLIPLTPVEHCRAPVPAANGSSNLGRAFSFLVKRFEGEVRRHAPAQKGDWKPLVFLMTDGKPTDGWENRAEELKSRANLIVFGVGNQVNKGILRKMADADRVYLLKDLTREAFDQLIDFICSTLTTASQRSEGRIDSLQMSQPREKVVLCVGDDD
jgi:uncharacterized protein YegL